MSNDNEAPKRSLSQTEPVMVGAGVTAVIEAGIAVAVVMGWADLSAEQVASLMGFVGAAVILAGGWYGRQRAWSGPSVDAEVEGQTATALAEAAFESGFDEPDQDLAEELEDAQDEDDPDLAGTNV